MTPPSTTTRSGISSLAPARASNNVLNKLTWRRSGGQVTHSLRNHTELARIVGVAPDLAGDMPAYGAYQIARREQRLRGRGYERRQIDPRTVDGGDPRFDPTHHLRRRQCGRCATGEAGAADSAPVAASCRCPAAGTPSA